MDPALIAYNDLLKKIFTFSSVMGEEFMTCPQVRLKILRSETSQDPLFAQFTHFEMLRTNANVRVLFHHLSENVRNSETMIRINESVHVSTNCFVVHSI